MSTRSHLVFPYVGLCVVLVGCGDRVDKLIAQLGDPNAATRRVAARQLGNEKPADDHIVSALAKAVADSEVEVQQAAITALGQMGPAAESSLPALRDALEDPEIAVRRAAALAIQHVDPAEQSFQPVLVTALREGDGRTMLAVGAMGKDAAWAVPTLIGLLTHREAKVRALAAHTLGRIGPTARDAKAALRRLLRDPNPAVSGAAQDALDGIEKEPATENR